VRTEAEFAEGHVDGSTNIPLDQVASQLEKFKEKSKLVVLQKRKSQQSSKKNDIEQNGIKTRH
jgi:rhodanese-related sulfurtransferase